MNQRLQQVLERTGGNYIFPFFWQHGEDEVTLRTYMRVIHNANIGAVCVESRPHPDFCGQGWWHDMDIILDEARNRNMKVWILDDSHFPTGYANGVVENASEELCRQSICANHIEPEHKAGIVTLKLAGMIPPPFTPSLIEKHILSRMPPPRVYHDDSIVSVSAFCSDTKQSLDLSPYIHDGTLSWQKPEGKWTVWVCGLSRNCGPHRNYINMLKAPSVKLLLDAVYEPHWRHYKNDFGKTLAGFFSDEPELGNGHLYDKGNVLGTDQDLPFSDEMVVELEKRLGANWAAQMYLLWENSADGALKAKARYAYMDAVTRLVEKDFSMQIGEWCRNHGVEYIGHIIEDDNQHARTGSSLGHYFRGMTGQDMAGIDVIGNQFFSVSRQVFPQGEDQTITGQIVGNRDGEFYHYTLAKLASSFGAIDPGKKGRGICEIFGNYGWGAGVRLQKYLADHFMVRGINNYVPHAFSPKEFPDPDCPPHFYAHGHNPQYRHFGKLMAYMNRICNLISGGRHIAPVAVLYHGEAEWTGNYMLTQKPCHLLADSQIDYDIIPQDIFAEPERYKTVLGKKLRVNTQEYKILLVPYMEYVTEEFALAAAYLHGAGFPIVFIGGRPKGICNAADNTKIPAKLNDCPVSPLEGIIDFIREKSTPELTINPSNNRIRYLRYVHDDGMSLYYFVNEGTEIYRGVAVLPENGSCAVYNAWDNCLEQIEVSPVSGGTEVKIEIEPLKSLIVVFDTDLPADTLKPPLKCTGRNMVIDEGWKRSVCGGIDYPEFSGHKAVNLPDSLVEEEPEFSGFVRYERQVTLEAKEKIILEITDAHEGVEVFVNGVSAGIQIVPPYRFDISFLVKNGVNDLAIEAATTLERQLWNLPSLRPKPPEQKPSALSGITGHVNLYYREYLDKSEGK